MEHLHMIEDLLCKFCDLNPGVLPAAESTGRKTW